MTEYPHIIKIGERWYVEGSKVPVHRIWCWFRRGTTAETLFKRYPNLGCAKILTALAFAYDNQEEMGREDALMRTDYGSDQRKLPF